MPAPAPWTPSFISTEVETAVRIIAARSGIRRVWLFGSVARNEKLDAYSDLDFAVEGLPATEHFDLLGELLLELRCAVDLLRWEEAGDHLRSRILREGSLIYAG